LLITVLPTLLIVDPRRLLQDFPRLTYFLRKW
jgi:hypothetical protein